MSDLGDPLAAGLAGLHTQLGELARSGVDPVSDDDLADAVRSAERALRRLESLRALLCAESARRHERLGRSTGSAATTLAEQMGVTVGQARRAIELGRRATEPSGAALSTGEISVAQERAVAEAVDRVPSRLEGRSPESLTADRAELAQALTRSALAGSGPGQIASEGARRLRSIDPDRTRRAARRQQQDRSLVSPTPDSDLVSTVSITCEPRLRALLDAVIARFGSPGSCIPGAVDPESGEPGPAEPSPADDTRSPRQRAYDALCHVLALGLAADGMRAPGIASIVVRITPEQLDDPGALVTTDCGTDLTVAQAVSMAGNAPWFVSVLREGREELHRIDVDAGSKRGRTRIGTRLQRLVLYAVRAGGCSFPGCDVPAARCQFHHVRSWARGGPTTVANGTLACPCHHGRVGDDATRWRTVPDQDHPGDPVWIPPTAVRQKTRRPATERPAGPVDAGRVGTGGGVRADAGRVGSERAAA